MKYHKYSELAKRAKGSPLIARTKGVSMRPTGRMDMAMAVMLGVISGIYIFKEPLERHRAISSSTAEKQQHQ